MQIKLYNNLRIFCFIILLLHRIGLLTTTGWQPPGIVLSLHIKCTNRRAFNTAIKLTLHMYLVLSKTDCRHFSHRILLN